MEIWLGKGPSSYIFYVLLAVAGGGGGRRANLLPGSINGVGILPVPRSFSVIFINGGEKELWRFMCIREQLWTPPRNDGGSFVSETSKM